MEKEYTGINETNDHSSISFTADMNILPENDTGLYAVGDVTADDMITITGVKVVFLKDEESGEDRLTVCLPRYHNPAKDSWDTVISLTKEQKKELDAAVVQDIKRKMHTHLSLNETPVSIRINLCEERFLPTVAYAEVSYKESISMKKIRIREGTEGSLQVLFPSNKQKNGTYASCFSMATSELREWMADLVRDAFYKEYASVKGKNYVPSGTGEKRNAAEPSVNGRQVNRL